MIRINDLIFLLVLPGIFFISSCNRDLTPEQVERLIAKSDSLKDLDTLCRELPKPEGFEFSDKVLSGNMFTSTLGYRYKTRSDFTTVKIFYFNWFEKNGWAHVTSRGELTQRDWGYLEFKRQGKSIAVEHVNTPGIDYEIDCIGDNYIEK